MENERSTNSMSSMPGQDNNAQESKVEMMNDDDNDLPCPPINFNQEVKSGRHA
ncbi:hypothetical protein SNOG_14679 [Parastagonospora nodorum SN15]|uniref:Uncharacterized protein n=1 Tax=Phaeosphaeria nodorum (strain SN15 / ATCC MYA-4574 / FGSC 10173) TaxID=321614 RepID=Q0U0H4_PHANO|nr:hypothetical protein SNOG_14679 [Parastagonospora nodorum SN15]EAT77871.1 hypothetical protein SNOG_14679 [Parastagonospora nodorum SN15]